MKYFLDTNICIYFLKGLFPELRDQLLARTPVQIKIASIVKAELLLGAYKSNNPSRTGKSVTEFLLPFEIVPFDDQASENYSRIRGSLEKKGQSIGPNDLILAATVVSNQGMLITNNVAEFGRVAGIKIDNWIA